MNNDTSKIVVYLRNTASITQYVLGLIKLTEVDTNNTLVAVGVQHKYDTPLFGKNGAFGALFLSFTNEPHPDCE